jgi:hypothetical protein
MALICGWAAARRSRNALKHGLTALLDCEDRTQFDETLNKFLGIHGPATPAETDIVEEMVAARWRIPGLFNAEILTQQSNPGDPDIHLASAFRVLADDSRSLALANRYEARLQRLYDRALQNSARIAASPQVRTTRAPAEHPNQVG